MYTGRSLIFVHACRLEVSEQHLSAHLKYWEKRCRVLYVIHRLSFGIFFRFHFKNGRISWVCLIFFMYSMYHRHIGRPSLGRTGVACSFQTNGMVTSTTAPQTTATTAATTERPLTLSFTDKSHRCSYEGCNRLYTTLHHLKVS